MSIAMIDFVYEPAATTIPVLRYLVAVADAGHFGRAAERCGIAQPTLSAQIRKWEQRLDICVFERGPRGAMVTRQGQDIIARARQILDALAALEESTRHGGDSLSGSLRCGMIPTIAPYLLPHLLPHCERELPQLRFELHELQTQTLLRELDEHRLDCGILARLDRTAPYASALCYEEGFWLACPHDDPVIAQESITPGDLLHERMLLLQDGHCFRDQALDLCGARPEHPHVRCIANTLETLCQLVGAGFGCTLLPELAVRADEHRFTVRKLELPGATRQVDLIWRSSDPRSEDFQRLARVVHNAIK